MAARKTVSESLLPHKPKSKNRTRNTESEGRAVVLTAEHTLAELGVYALRLNREDTCPGVRMPVPQKTADFGTSNTESAESAHMAEFWLGCVSSTVPE